MSDKRTYRCINPFLQVTAKGEKLYTGGMEVEGGDSILKTHRAYFVPVEEAAPVLEGVEEPKEAPAAEQPPEEGGADMEEDDMAPDAIRTETATSAPGEPRAVTRPRPRGRKPESADESKG